MIAAQREIRDTHTLLEECDGVGLRIASRQCQKLMFRSYQRVASNDRIQLIFAGEVDDVGHRDQNLHIRVSVNRQVDQKAPQAWIDRIEQHELAGEEPVDVDSVTQAGDRSLLPEDRAIGRMPRGYDRCLVGRLVEADPDLRDIDTRGSKCGREPHTKCVVSNRADQFDPCVERGRGGGRVCRGAAGKLQRARYQGKAAGIWHDVDREQSVPTCNSYDADGWHICDTVEDSIQHARLRTAQMAAVG